MTKVGKTMKNITKEVVKASGVATKVGGEAISKVARKVGVSEDKCDRMEDKSDDAGKDIYYSNQSAGYKAEKMTDQAINKTRDMYHSIIDKDNSKPKK